MPCLHEASCFYRVSLSLYYYYMALYCDHLIRIITRIDPNRFVSFSIASHFPVFNSYLIRVVIINKSKLASEKYWFKNNLFSKHERIYKRSFLLFFLRLLFYFLSYKKYHEEIKEKRIFNYIFILFFSNLILKNYLQNIRGIQDYCVFIQNERKKDII